MSAGGRYYPTAIREGTHEIREGTHEIHMDTHVNFWVQMIPITPQQFARIHMKTQRWHEFSHEIHMNPIESPVAVQMIR